MPSDTRDICSSTWPAGSGAALAHAALHPSSLMPLIGASGAVAAVMGAYFVLYPKSQVLNVVFLIVYRDVIEVPAFLFLGLWLVLQLLTPLAPMGAQAADIGLSFDACIAGFALGAIVGFVQRRRRRWN